MKLNLTDKEISEIQDSDEYAHIEAMIEGESAQIDAAIRRLYELGETGHAERLVRAKSLIVDSFETYMENW